MGEQSISKSADKAPNQEQNKDASEALLTSLTRSELVSNPTGGIKSNSDKTLEAIAEYKAGRYALVTAEGLSLLPSGVLNGIKHNWDHPGEFATKMGTAAAMGAGLRFLLPQSGGAKAVVGTIFTYMMAKDAVTPVLGAWSQVSDDKSMANIHDAATRMSNGLGLFTVDMVAGLPVGLAADKLTGYALKSTARGRAFESWKEDFYSLEKGPLGKVFGSGPKAEVPGQPSMEQRLKAIKDGTVGQDGKPLSIDDKLRLISENLEHKHAIPKELTPDAQAAFKAYLEHKRWHKTEMPSKIDQLLGDNAGAAEGVKAGSASESTLAAADLLAKRATLKAVESGEPGAGKSAEAGLEKPSSPAPVLDKNAQTVGQMATTLRDVAAKTNEEAMQIGNFKESVQSPLTQTMRTGKPPLDEGHWANNKNLVELTEQIQTLDHVKQAGFLLEHHRVANVQMGIPEKMPEIVALNQYSRSVHKNLMDLLIREGINPETVLRGTNSPIFLIFDSSGSGPYTIPAIKGVTDTAVIVLPREYKSALGVHVAGVYPHELGHDLIYGDLLRFPENLRDKVLNNDVVAEAMKAKGIADTPVEVPGHGSMKKSEFFTKLLLAEANENTADIFGTAMDPNTGLSLAPLLSSLRKPAAGAPKGAPGQLETRSMYGEEFVDPVDNPLGIEHHGIDAWRIKLSAEVLRQLSGNDPKVSKFAGMMDNLSESMRRPGDNYVWASMDNKGQYVSIPIKEWDAIIPGIVKAQLETPLPALNNKSLRNVYPDMTKTFPKVDALSDQIASAARNNDGTFKFDKAAHGIEDVYSAGLSGWMKAIAQNPESGKPGYVAPDVLLERINGINKALTALYANDKYTTSMPPAAPAKPISFANLVTKPVGFMSKSVGNMVESSPTAKSMFGNWSTKAGIGTGLALTRDMFDTEQRMHEIFKQQGH
ncbi:MAG: hypothetical protein K2X27_27765 [Candidatus Obscuribacterales bacterium]|nr:hypothetical protein [Candidatus Obscuribacterales bacterium]